MKPMKVFSLRLTLFRFSGSDSDNLAKETRILNRLIEQIYEIMLTDFSFLQLLRIQ